MNSLILIVDDQIENLKVIGNLLKDQGYRIALSKNAQEVFEVLSSVEPDLILLDVMMPELDGFELCRKLKSDPHTKEIPIIFLTARTGIDDVVEGFKLGAVDYIGKPFNYDELLVRVATHLELRRARRQIEQQADALRKLNHEKDRIFSIISHDALTPVSSMQMLIETLIENPSGSGSLNIHDALLLIQISTAETRYLLENLLHWSRGQMGRTHCAPVYFNLNELVTKICRLYQHVIRQKEIRIETRLPNEAVVFADEEMTRIVLRNLIGNAIKFSKWQGLIHIDLTRNEHNWKLGVTDYGVGMDQNTLHRIFDEQDDLSMPGTQGEKGTGLGIKICMNFIAKNNGAFWAESSPGKGSTFYFTLPDRKPKL
jgi:two-component system, sensor histidine kinase and response regulator